MEGENADLFLARFLCAKTHPSHSADDHHSTPSCIRLMTRTRIRCSCNAGNNKNVKMWSTKRHAHSIVTLLLPTKMAPSASTPTPKIIPNIIRWWVGSDRWWEETMIASCLRYDVSREEQAFHELKQWNGTSSWKELWWRIWVSISERETINR